MAEKLTVMHESWNNDVALTTRITGDLDVLTYIIDKKESLKSTTIHQIVEVAAAYNHLNILEYFGETYYDLDRPTLGQDAVYAAFNSCSKANISEDTARCLISLLGLKYKRYSVLSDDMKCCVRSRHIDYHRLVFDKLGPRIYLGLIFSVRDSNTNMCLRIVDEKDVSVKEVFFATPTKDKCLTSYEKTIYDLKHHRVYKYIKNR
jgi:hypothetical protein